MAAGLLAITNYSPARDRNGALVPGARMRVRQNRTTTLATVYADANLTTPLANPVIANSSGQFPAVWAQGGTAEAPVLYSVDYSASDGTTIGNPNSFDDVQPSVSLDLVSGALKADIDLDNVPDAALIERGPRTIPVNNLVAFLGDSITANGIANGVIPGVDNDANATRNCSRGMLSWLPFLTSQRFQSRQDLNFGVSGQTAQQIAARVGDVIDSGAGTCVVIAGTNNVGTNDYTDCIAALDAIYRALDAANILAIAYPILPRVVSGGANYGFINRVNEWIEKGGERYANFKFIDPYIFGEPYALDMAPKTGFTWDGLHPTSIGMRYITQPLAEFMNTLLPEPTPRVRSVTDHFSSDNPTGYANLNPMLAGDTGTKGSGVTGDVATDWQLSITEAGGNVASLTVAGSKVTSAANRVAQRILIGGTATGGFATRVALSQTNFAGTTFKAGDTIQAEAQIQTSGGAAEIAGIALLLSTTQNGVVKSAYDAYPIVSDEMTLDAISGVLRTPQMTLTHDDTSASVGLLIYLRNTTSAARGLDLEVQSVAVRKVV